MRVNSFTAETSFSAKLNENTRRIIKDLDKHYNNNLEGRIDNAINNSPLADFYGDKAIISFVETENPHCNIAPTISIEVGGIEATHVLKGDSTVCEEQDEEFLIEKMNRRPYRYINTIVNRLNSETPSQVKKCLIEDYLKKLGADTNSSNVDVNTFDLLC